jgi:dihydroorotate dehydrogenase (fumarate)
MVVGRQTQGGWTRYAKLIQDAGADALELNIYYLPTDLTLTSEVVERQYCDLVREVKKTDSDRGEDFTAFQRNGQYGI